MKTQQSQPIQSGKVKNSFNADMERLACLWIELLINGILEDCKSSFPVVLEKKSIDNFNREL